MEPRFGEQITDLIYSATDEELLKTQPIFAELTQYINNLILTDFEKLINLLYRLDIDENKLKALLNQQKKSDAGALIASMIIERQIAKIQSRKRSTENPTQPDNLDESW